MAVVNVSVYNDDRAIYSSLSSENWLFMTEPTAVPDRRAAGHKKAMIKFRRKNANTSVKTGLVV